jgi:hypothetical protein
MARTLNPQLFGTGEPLPVKGEPQSQSQIKKFREMEVQIEVLNNKLEKWVQILDSKIQQLHVGQKNLSEQLRQSVEGFSAQQAALHSKLNERRGSDLKTQEIVDRHNQLIHRFEARVSQIQKISSEQEMKLMTYQATYDEILREIRNLKS